MTLYNKVKNDRWEESDVCMSITARFGTGGNNIPIVMEETNDNRNFMCGELPWETGTSGYHAGYVSNCRERV